MFEITPLKPPQLNPLKVGLVSAIRAIKVFERVVCFFLYKQASLMQATRKASK